MPLRGAGRVLFGMGREEVRGVLRMCPQRCDRDSWRRDVEIFEDLGARVTYERDGKCGAIEFTGPAEPELNWKPVFGVPAARFERWLRSTQPEIEHDDEWIVWPNLGLALRADIRTRKRQKAQSAVAFAVDHQGEWPDSRWMKIYSPRSAFQRGHPVGGRPLSR